MFLIAFNFLRSLVLVVWQLVRQLKNIMFIKHNPHHFTCAEQKIEKKHQKLSKYYEITSLQTFLVLLIFVSTINFVNNSLISARIFFYLSKRCSKTNLKFFDNQILSFFNCVPLVLTKLSLGQLEWTLVNHSIKLRHFNDIY